MNNYIHSLTGGNVLGLIGYLIVVYFILFFVMKKLLLKDKFNKWFILGLMIFNFVILIVSVYIKLIPGLPDANLYSNIVTTGIMPVGKPEEITIGFNYCSIIFRNLAYHNILWYIPFNFMVNEIGIFIMWKSWCLYKRNKGIEVMRIQQRIFLILTACYPMALLAGIVPLRSSYFLLFFAILLYGLVHKSLVNIYWIIGTIGVYYLRKQYLIVLAVVLIMKLYNKIKFRNRKSKVIVAVIVGIVVCGVGYYLIEHLYHISITPWGIANFRNSQTEVYSGSRFEYPQLHWTSWWNVISYSPLLLFQFLIAPLPVVKYISLTKSLAYTCDGLFVVMICSIFLLGIKKNCKNYFWIFIFCLLWFCNGMFEYYITAAVRHRYEIVLMIIAGLTDAFYKFKEVKYK